MNKLLKLSLAGLTLTAAAQAEIVLTDDLSTYGYIDTAYATSDDLGAITGSVAEFELGFAFTPEGAWSAVSEISFDYSDSMSAAFETVTLTYAASDELSYTVGNILSYQGFETYDATGLYQFSYQGLGGNPVYSAAYAFGGSVDYVTDDHTVGLWLGEASEALSVEFLYKYTGVENLTLAFIYADDPGYTTANFWASYTVDALTYAIEYTDSDYTGTAMDTSVFMGMVNVALGDAGGLTFRYSSGELDGTDFDRYTISPSYTFSDNVLGLLEFSIDDIDGGSSESFFAAELLFTF